ncbi:MAG: hypothetical protein A2X25_06725 [Chloroflexi bacterium GWB2_49_20]|nr:MAG: hypothetical protein A2X25_06725 [Chloroflexi bacterium GWB2_49_20]OGN80268.1 MAG: hypothetical protein A2X26_08055 [Chloroflexi bacterium GWC2_49_37]OGN86092.1 MAG: hypothetical protein A2X27_00690 [Chloroflexi bacterium GWD2_49_16]HCC79397.1 hypothetical protein [Anaerolineae bacterium]HCM96382.1 hypothetical protein [Anaerolineae bacterium]
MKKKMTISIGILVVAFFLLRFSFAVMAAPASQLQQFATPTAGPDGRIIYIVKANDTCSLISILTGVSQDLLRQMNHLGENCIVFEGQELILGMGGPSIPTATSIVSQQPTSIIPSATPFLGNAQVCVALYNDVNGDGLRQANTDEFDAYIADGTEPTIEGGAVSLSSLTGTYSETLSTLEGLDPVCFSDVPEGNYTVSAAVPDGYNPTTDLTYILQLKPGDQTYVSIGAQSKSQTSQENNGQAKSPILGILGAILLLGGLGVGFFAFRMKK